MRQRGLISPSKRVTSLGAGWGRSLACTATTPPILLADEPTGSLDSEAGRTVLDLIERLRAESGLTIVLVTHDTDVAARADRLVHMLDGRQLVEPGTSQELATVAFLS